MAEPARCRSCGAEIAWATTPGNSLIPLDAAPRDTGNLAVHRNPRGDLIARPLKAGEQPDAHEKPGISHFATCSDAASHRRRRGR
jgi:hypothetical protein